jgi:hypothetical protein
MNSMDEGQHPLCLAAYGSAGMSQIRQVSWGNRNPDREEIGMNKSCCAAEIALVLLVGATCACNNPTSKIEPVEKKALYRSRIQDTVETFPVKSDLRDNPMRGVSGAQIYTNILKSDDGKVIGILFSTPGGDVCEMRDGYTDVVAAGDGRDLPSGKTP